jgi:hypothetical protein
LIYESRVKIKSIEQKIFCKENYKVVIIMGFLLHQSIVSKIFLIDTLLNTKYSLKSRDWYILYFLFY